VPRGRVGRPAGVDTLAALVVMTSSTVWTACDDSALVQIIIPIVAVALIGSMIYMGVRNYRYSLLEQRSRKWPIVEATIQKGEARFHGPLLSLFAGKLPKSLFSYSYTVAALRHLGFFAVYREDGISALELQDRLAGEKVSVRYDPDCPTRSFIVEREILGTPIHQNPDWLPASIRAIPKS
jgi:hypothetical protein